MTSTTEMSFVRDLPITAWPQGSGLPLHAFGSVRKCSFVTTAPPVRDGSGKGRSSCHLAVELGRQSRPAPWYDTDAGHLMNVQRVLNVALEHRDVLARGAVVLEGDEPLFQATFGSALLQVCQESGLRTEMVTSGADSDRVNDRMLRDIDLITVSLPPRPDWLGEDAQDAVRLVGRLEQLGCPMRLQIPVIPEHDLGSRDEADLAQALSKLTGLRTIEVYDCDDPGVIPPAGPCHRRMTPVQPPSVAALRLKRALLAAGLRVE